MASRRASRRDRRPRTLNTAFLNVPYDAAYERLYLAFIAGLCGFGLTPRATVEIPGSERRLNRILGLIRSCRYSFHDLSRVEVDRKPPSTPRFNMPFELGLTVASATLPGSRHTWYVFEAVNRRLNKSLSDLDGTDPYIHGAEPRRLFRALTNALVRGRHQPTVNQLENVYADLMQVARRLKRELRTDSLFEARPFRDLVVAATRSAENTIVSLRE
jgi:hypothetical protein